MAPPWPNPLGSENVVRIAFDIPAGDVVSIRLFNPAGQLVARRPSRAYVAGGEHTVSWALPALPSGVYFVRIATSRGLSAQRKLAIIR